MLPDRFNRNLWKGCARHERNPLKVRGAQTVNTLMPLLPVYSWRGVLCHSLSLLPLFYFFTLMWWIPDGMKYLSGLIPLALLGFVFTRAWRSKDKEIIERQKLFLWTFWVWMAYSLIIFFWMEDSWTEVRGYLLTATYVSIIAGLRVSRRFLVSLLVVCAVTLVSLSFWQYAQGVSRVHGYINANTYAATLGSLSILIACITRGCETPWSRRGLGALALLLAVALFMTGSRGVTAAFCLVAALLYVYLMIRSRNKVSLSLVGGLLFVCILLPVGWWIMQERIDYALEEISNLDESNSIGLRLEMWEVAAKVIPHSPIFGIGEGHYTLVKKLYENGTVSDRLHRFHLDHFHNQIIDYTVKKGVVGALLFMALIGLGVYGVWKNVSFESGRLASLGFAALYAGSSMASVPFHHPETIFLFFIIVTLLSAVDGESLAAVRQSSARSKV